MKKKILSKKFAVISGLIIFVLAIFLGIFAYFKTEAKRPPLTKLDLKSSGRFVDLVPVTSPTSIITNPPTSTPTLTPGQIAEIEKNKFINLNAKYGPCKKVPILMFHHVLPSDLAKALGAANLNVNPETFRQQLDYLIGKGYSIIGLDEVLSKINDNTLPDKPVVLTFDDGYRDFYDYVFPVLKEKNIKATVFVISQFAGGERYLTWFQLKELDESGLALVGNHTLNHANLLKVESGEAKNQIISAKKIIEEHLGKSIRFFAYPYGGVDQDTRDILKENEFSVAVTTVQGTTQCVGLPYDFQRIRIGGGALSRYGL